MRWLLLAAISFVSGQVQCPDGYTAPATYTGYCYKYSPATLTWNGHEAFCSSATLNGQPYAGGHLATIFDQPSATAVMDLYCNGLSQQFGQMHYFVGYYCISSSYTYRPDWRWTSGRPTIWLHGAPAYLSGAEPDDAGCGRAHYSDDGANTGRIGDWSCGSPLSGGCCEAPVVPTPSPTMTPSNTLTATSTQTATRTQTSTNTQTGTRTGSSTETATQTAAATQTRTASKTSTETRTATATATATSTATSTETPTPSSSTSTSPSSSASPSSSPSPSASSSISPSATITTTPSISTSITPTPRPIAVFAVGESGVTAAGQESLGVGAGPDTSAQEAAAQQKFVVSVVAGAGAAALIFALCCGWLLCALRRRRQIREKKARAALASKQQTRSKAQTATVAATLGMKTPTKPNALFRSMNPALLTGPITRETRGPRLSMALSAYKSPTSFRPQPVANQHRQSTVAESLLENPQSDEVEDAVIGVDEQPEQEEQSEDVEQTGETGKSKEYEETEEYEEEAVQDDAVDEDEDIATALAKKTAGKHVDLERTIQQRTKKSTESAVAPPMESKKLVIGKGALVQEHVQRQTVQLRRVSKVRGDQQLTALRQHRPSTRAGYAPQASSRNILNPYEFTATVSRVIVKTDM